MLYRKRGERRYNSQKISVKFVFRLAGRPHTILHVEPSSNVWEGEIKGSRELSMLTGEDGTCNPSAF